MGLELAKAYVVVRGDTSKVAGDFIAGKAAVSTAARGLSRMVGGILATAGAALTISAIISQIREGIGLAQVQIDAEAKVAAVIKGTGGAAGYTADKLKEMASAFQDVTTFGDEGILEMQSRLLTFKTITGDVFEKASEVVLDMAATLGTSAAGAALQLGRALEDPIRGINALRMTGVSFSEQQKEYIKQLVETNQLSKAQAYILDTVQGKLGGVAEAMAATDSGKLKQAHNVLGSIKEEIGKKVIPAQIMFVKWQQIMSTALLATVDVLARVIKANWTFISAVGTLVKVIGAVTAAFMAYQVVLKTVAITKAIVLSLSGPKGWVALAAGVIVATATIADLNSQFNQLKADVIETAGETKAADDALGVMTDQISEVEKLTAAVAGLASELEKLRPLSIRATTAMGFFMRVRDTIDQTVKQKEALVNMQGVAAGFVEGAMIITPISPVRQAALEDELASAIKTRDQINALEKEYGDLGKASTHLAKLLESIQHPQERLLELERKLRTLRDAGMINAGQAAELYRKAWEESALGKPIAEINKLQQSVSNMSVWVSDVDIAVQKFSELEFVTPQQIKRFRELQEEMKGFQDDMKEDQELKNLKRKWESLLETPAEKLRVEMRELKRLREEGLISEEKYGKGREKLLAGMKEGGLGTARFGFADFGRQLQDMVLKQDDPQKKIEDNTRRAAAAAEEWNVKSGEMIDRMPTAQQLEDISGYA